MRRGVASWLVPLALLLAILALPFLAKRSARDRPAPMPVGAETLVIITPHSEAIRHEFTESFTAHMARQGRPAVRRIGREAAAGGAGPAAAQRAGPVALERRRVLGRQHAVDLAAAAGAAPVDLHAPALGGHLGDERSGELPANGLVVLLPATGGAGPEGA